MDLDLRLKLRSRSKTLPKASILTLEMGEHLSAVTSSDYRGQQHIRLEVNTNPEG